MSKKLLVPGQLKGMTCTTPIVQAVGMRLNCTPGVVHGTIQKQLHPVHYERVHAIRMWQDYRLYIALALYIFSFVPVSWLMKSKALKEIPETSNDDFCTSEGREDETIPVYLSRAQQDGLSDSEHDDLDDDVKGRKVKHVVRHIHEGECEKVWTMSKKIAHYMGIDLLMLTFVDRGHFTLFISLLVVFSFVLNASHLVVPWRALGREVRKTHGTVTFQGTSLFLALNHSHIVDVMIRFMAMFFLMTFLIIALWRSGTNWPEGVCKDVPWWATLLMQLAGDQQMGTGFKPVAKLWAHILRADYVMPYHPGVGLDEVHQEDYNEMLDHKLCGPLVRSIRCFLAIITNGVFFDVVLYTLPLLLMTAETSLDFVKDSFAVVFIVTLDDIGEPKENVIHCPIFVPVEIRTVPDDESLMTGRPEEADF